MAPFLFAALAAACVASLFGTVAPTMAAVALLAIAAWSGDGKAFRLTGLAAAVLAYGGFLAFHTLAFSSAYSAAGLLHPLLLGVAFVAGRRAFSEERRRAAGLALIVFGVVLAIWGLTQVGLLGVGRAHAALETPAIYGAVLNVVLLGAAAYVLSGRRDLWLLASTFVIGAALVAAGSRGAWIAVAAGLGVAGMLSLRAGKLRAGNVGLVLALVAAAVVAVAALRAVSADGLQADADLQRTPSELAQVDSTQSRLELYKASWNAWQASPLLGTGYLTFRYILEQQRAAIPSYGAVAETWVVHNDYLQALQETGPLGLATLLFLVVAPLVLAYCRVEGLPDHLRVPAVAATAALAATALHALVDFPFHVPITLALFGVALGALDVTLQRKAQDAHAPSPLWRPARAGFALIAAVVLLRPFAAEAAAEWGMRQFLHGQGHSAAFWLGVAQRIEPADWRYHWYAGQFWEAQTAVSRKPEAAQLALEAFDAGLRANPYEVRNLLGKISVQRRFHDLLDGSRHPERLREWVAHATRLAPLNPAVARERAQVESFLAEAGQ